MSLSLLAGGDLSAETYEAKVTPLQVSHAPVPSTLICCRLPSSMAMFSCRKRSATWRGSNIEPSGRGETKQISKGKTDKEKRAMIYQETEHALPSFVLAPCTSLAFRQMGLIRTT